MELAENGMQAEKSRQQQFFELAERFCDTVEAGETRSLGDELGRMIFGDACRSR